MPQSSQAMNSGSQYILFIGACLALVAIPGPAVAFIVARSLSQGTTVGVTTAAGIALGNLVQALAAAFGLAALLAASPFAYQTIKYIGGAYLCYLGIRGFFGSNNSGANKHPSPQARTALLQGFLVGLLNPKVALFLIAFLLPFTNPEQGDLWLQVLLLGLTFVLIGWGGDTTWALCSGVVGKRLQRGTPAKWTRFASSIIYCTLGLITAFFMN